MVYGYYAIRKNSSEDLYSQKEILNKTNLFFNKALQGNEIYFDTIIQKMQNDYEIEVVNQYHLKFFPKNFSSPDFYGYELMVDSTNRKIKYIGLYKP
ncbi:hypothetical protein GCM10011368_06810 [Hyunsoonleella pacifica]|nr:hypothetical protein GCM10011368_06810 [Hyunsoonleella pacifica]